MPYARAMVMSRLVRPDPLARVRSYALALADREGHNATPSPELCLYRFSRPTRFQKGATFGVTLGVVLQGEKRMRIAGEEIAIESDRFLVITRDVAYESLATQATAERPFLGVSILFRPEQVARALLAYAEPAARRCARPSLRSRCRSSSRSSTRSSGCFARSMIRSSSA